MADKPTLAGLVQKLVEARDYTVALAHGADDSTLILTRLVSVALNSSLVVLAEGLRFKESKPKLEELDNVET